MVIKIKVLFVVLILTQLLANGQKEDKGIQFADSTLSWKEIQAKASEENKYIFVDCFTTWCGPCKYMSRTIFPKKDVGDYFNAHFISVSIQMDKTPKDASAVKKWYDDVDTIAQKYKITEYPTYLIFSPQGVALHRFGGAADNTKEFIEKTSNGLDSTKQYYTLMNHWKEHRGDSAFLLNALNMALIMSDDQQAELLGDEYIRSLRSLMKKNNVEIIQQIIYSSKDLAFQLYLSHAKEIDALMASDNYVEWTLQDVIFQEKIAPLCKNRGVVHWNQIAINLKSAYPTLTSSIIHLEETKFQKYITLEIRGAISKDTAVAPDFISISRKLQSRYFRYQSVIGRLLLQEEAAYYAKKGQWVKCANTAYLLMSRYGMQISEHDMDNIAWDYIFLHSSDKAILAEASRWMKRTVTLKPGQADDLDTYANLLYKMGNKNAAVKLENKVVDLAIKEHAMPEDLSAFRSNLEKMQKGVITWE